MTDIGPVLDAALAELARYVIAPLHRLATAVLWSAYVHLLPRADLGIDVAPRLGIRSKVKRSGKSTLLECVDNLTPNPVLAGSITPSSIFRIIDATRATLLIDEADHIVNKNSSPDLLAILNSGHRRRTAYVIRSVPTEDGGWVPVKFNTFTGIAFAGLETLPETLQDRSIGLPLHKATREEKPEHLVNGYSPVLIECRRKFARWAADLTELPAVTMPPELFNRTGDNWRGLFGIAEAAGGEWPERAKQAAMEEISEEDSNRTLQLLEAIWQIFAEKKVVRMHTKVLLAALMNIEEAPWEDGERRPRDRRRTGCGKSSRGSCRGPQIPKRRRRSAAPAQWREGKAPPQGIHGGPSARGLEAVPRPQDPERDAKAAGPMDRQRTTPPAADPKRMRPEHTGRPETNGETGPAADGERCERGQGHHRGERCAQWTRTGAAADPPERSEARRGGMNHGSDVPNAPCCAHFKVRPSYATDAATATALVAAIVADAGEGLIAVDFETTPLPSERERRADLRAG